MAHIKIIAALFNLLIIDVFYFLEDGVESTFSVADGPLSEFNNPDYSWLLKENRVRRLKFIFIFQD